LSPFDGLADFNDFVDLGALVEFKNDQSTRTCTNPVRFVGLDDTDLVVSGPSGDQAVSTMGRPWLGVLDDFVDLDDSVAYDGLASTSDQSVVQAVDKDNQSTWTTRLRLVGSLPTHVGSYSSNLVVSSDQAVSTRTISRPCLRRPGRLGRLRVSRLGRKSASTTRSTSTISRLRRLVSYLDRRTFVGSRRPTSQARRQDLS
jgi:hypothetical protein